MKTYIFDIARVILSFEPYEFLLSKGLTDEQVEKVSNALFKSELWLKMDRGVVDKQLAVDQIKRENAEIADNIQFVADHWMEMLQPIDETVELIRLLRTSGHRLFYLSNLHDYTKEYVLNKFPEIWSMFEGGIFSCDVHLLKPEEEIFTMLLTEFNLNKAECIYIDDSLDNVKKASAMGIESIHFTSPQVALDLKERIK